MMTTQVEVEMDGFDARHHHWRLDYRSVCDLTLEDVSKDSFLLRWSWDLSVPKKSLLKCAIGSMSKTSKATQI
jgi:hypothetical protein